jgi:hypothetical protein
MAGAAYEREWRDGDQRPRSSAEAAFLEPIVKRGIQAFLEGAEGLRMELRRVDDQLVPLVVSDGVRGKPAFTSPSAHHLDYPIHELARSSPWLPRPLLRFALLPLSFALAWGRIDRVVYINHWLLIGGPPLRLGRRQIERLIEELVADFPDHALVVCGIVPDLGPATASALIGAGGRAVQSRVVHLMDGRTSLRGRTMKPIRRNRKVDRQLHRENEFRRTSDPAVLLNRVERLRELYAELYLDKHPGGLNPRYRPAFFRLLVESDLFSTVAWQRDGDMDAFNVQYVSDGILSWSVCGVEVDRARDAGLFRLVIAEDFVAAEKQGLVVNWGGGNGRFKKLRGAEPTFEYDVVFDHHLGLRRRTPWAMLQRLRAWKNGAPRTPAPVTSLP